MGELKTKFKIGDLVRVVDIAFLMEDGVNINIGDVGIIVSMDPYDHEMITLWGIDYMVMLKGRRIMFFENELELINNET